MLFFVASVQLDAQKEKLSAFVLIRLFGHEFNDDNADDGEGNNVKVPASAKGKPKADAKPAAKSKVVQKPADEFDDDLIPF